MAKSDTARIGACGEFYVASYLTGCRMLVALPRAGVPGTDMFVAKAHRGTPLRVQVKTATRATKRDKEVGDIYLWSTPCSVIELNDDNLWYAYVWLNGWPDGAEVPEVFLVPSAFVVERMKAVRLEIEKRPKTWPFFWMRFDEAEQFRGKQGIHLLAEALNLHDETPSD